MREIMGEKTWRSEFGGEYATVIYPCKNNPSSIARATKMLMASIKRIGFERAIGHPDIVVWRTKPHADGYGRCAFVRARLHFATTQPDGEIVPTPHHDMLPIQEPGDVLDENAVSRSLKELQLYKRTAIEGNS